MAKAPVIDLGRCVGCEACLEVCPQIFSFSDAGYIEVADLPDYPEDCVEEAIKYCPTDCITWEER